MDPLTAKLGALRARLRSLALLSGLAWTFSITLLLMLLACAADWWFQLEPAALRVAAGCSIAAVAAVCLLRFVFVPLRRDCPDVALALEIEKLQPEWRNALSSAVQFSTEKCPPEVGAAALQRALIARLQPRIARLDPAAFLNPRHLLTPSLLAVLACLLTAAVIAADQERASLALQRLVQPGSAPAWPRQHTLVLLDELGEQLKSDGTGRLAPAGEPLRFYVADTAGTLPDEVRLHVRDRQGRVHTEPLRRTASPAGVAGDEAFIAIVPQLDEAVSIRATGGDDDRMPWHAVAFVPRPAVESLLIQLTPPAYTGLPVESSRADGPIEGVIGTRVRLEMTSNMPLSQARFRRDGHPPQDVPLEAGSRRGSVEFEIAGAGRFACWFELTEKNGLTSRDALRVEVRGIADGEPTVAIDQPAVDLTVTPQARLPVRVQARDDLRLTEVRLALSNPPGSAGELSYPFLLPDVPHTEVALETELSIADMGLTPGRVIQMRAEAGDAYDLGPPHVGRSLPRVLTVVSPAEKLQELQARQTGIAQSLERSFAMQNASWQQTRELQLQWSTARTLSDEDIDVLKRVTGNQQRIADELFDQHRGVAPRVSGILDELAWNQLDDAATSSRLATVQQQFARLEGEVFASLHQSLADARKALSSDALDDRESLVDSAFTTALAAHETASASLAMLLALFQEWQLQFDLNRELAAIVEGQQQLNQETLTIGRETVARRTDALTPQQKADLARLASRQQEAARQVDRLDERLEELMTTTDEDALPSADDVARALDVLRNATLAGDMRQAAEQIGQNNVPDAVNIQQRVMQTLESLDTAIRGIGAPSPETLLKHVEEAQQEAESLRERQTEALQASQELSESSAENADALQELRQQQQQLAADAQEWAQRLMRRQFGDAAATAARASRSTEAAADALESDVSPAAISAQQEALDDLLQAERQLARMREELEVTRALAEMARFASLLETLSARQQGLLDETIRLDAAQQERGSLSRAQLRSLQQLAGAQSQLSGDLAPAVELTADAPVLRAALIETQESMTQAAAQLADRTVDEATQQLQRMAVQRLSDMRRLLDDVRSPGSQQSSTSSADDGEAGGPGWSSLVQIRLLLQLQQEIAEQTHTLTVRRQSVEELNDAEQALLERLAQRQAALAELAIEVLGGEQSLPGADPDEPEGDMP